MWYNKTLMNRGYEKFILNTYTFPFVTKMKEDFIKENINKDFVNKAKWIEKLRLFYKWVNI